MGDDLRSVGAWAVLADAMQLAVVCIVAAVCEGVYGGGSYSGLQPAMLAQCGARLLVMCSDRSMIESCNKLIVLAVVPVRHYKPASQWLLKACDFVASTAHTQWSVLHSM
jgi:hypothetical protein